MNAEQARAAVVKYGSQEKAARAMKISEHTIRKALRDGMTAPAVAKKKSLSDFKATYDKDFIVPKKIKDAIRQLGTGGWEYEVAFAKAAGISLGDLATYREQFAAYVVEIRRDSKRAWAGSPATAEQMRSMV